ncbi:MAG: HEAT repeat domain-containing protein [Bacteroidota bacterium]
MQSSTPVELKKTLEDLGESPFTFQRREAAHALGHVHETSEEILRALIAAETLDSDPAVRSAAAQSLQEGVHRAFLEAHPDFTAEAAALAERNQKERQRTEEEGLIDDFIERRGRLRRRLLGFALVFVVWWWTFLLPFDLVLPAYIMGSVLVLLYLGYVFWWSWKNWRCPACDSWLGGWKAQVNPWFSSPPLRCPYCGEKLLM